MIQMCYINISSKGHNNHYAPSVLTGIVLTIILLRPGLYCYNRNLWEMYQYKIFACSKLLFLSRYMKRI
jgi:hypothetical protein